MAHKSQKLFMIGNAHIDPVWLWSWHDGFHEAKATFRSALDRMNEFPDFVFVASQAAVYAWVEHSEPEMFAEIQRRVAEGRWKIVGGWWVEPDCNIPSGESFVRQGLYGQHYFQQKFGQTATVGYCIDSFGHHAMLPQILRKSGLSFYIFMRPAPHEKELPARLFWWEADDGSRVLTFRIAHSYATWGDDLRPHIEQVAAELSASQHELMCFYGVGNHGGGPTIENMNNLHELQQDEQLPQIILSSPEEFFHRQLSHIDQLPVVHDDLQHHASGCYSAHSGVKQWNRKAENRLIIAEILASIAHQVTGQPYPTDFQWAWKNVLFHQFHDILAGTSLESTYDDTRDQIGESLSIADRALNFAVQSLAWKINVEPEPGLVAIAVFNPHAWPVKACIEVEISTPNHPVTLRNGDSQTIPYQMIHPHALANGRSRLCFIADVPSMGYTLYRLAKGTPSEALPSLSASPLAFSNGRISLAFDPSNGAICSLRDLTLNCERFAGPAALPLCIDDPSDTWSHGVVKFTDGETRPMQAHKIELVEAGPVKAVIRVTHTYGRSAITQEFSMYAALDQIDVAVTVDWRERQKMLKLRFPLNLTHANTTYEIPYGHIQRESNGDEQPGQKWIDCSGLSADTSQPVGLSLINDGKYSFDVNQQDVGMTILRSPIFAHHQPVVPEADQSYAIMDQGIQKFSYTLLPHRGDWIEAGTVRRALECNQRLPVLVTTVHPGPLPQQASYARIEPHNLVISAMKQAETGDDLIVRCYETAGISTHGRIHLTAWQRVIESTFGPCEIKTFRVPKDSRLPVIETNLLEWEEVTTSAA